MLRASGMVIHAAYLVGVLNQLRLYKLYMQRYRACAMKPICAHIGLRLRVSVA